MNTLRRLATTPTPTRLTDWRWELRAAFLGIGGLVAMLLGG